MNKKKKKKKKKEKQGTKYIKGWIILTKICNQSKMIWIDILKLRTEYLKLKIQWIVLVKD